VPPVVQSMVGTCCHGAKVQTAQVPGRELGSAPENTFRGRKAPLPQGLEKQENRERILPNRLSGGWENRDTGAHREPDRRAKSREDFRSATKRAAMSQEMAGRASHGNAGAQTGSPDIPPVSSRTQRMLCYHAQRLQQVRDGIDPREHRR